MVTDKLTCYRLHPLKSLISKLTR